MTRQDYILIANAISKVTLTAEGVTIAVSIAKALENNNIRFDMQKFLTACGISGQWE